MNALLIVAHGSRREASNEEIRALALQVADQAGNGYARVSAAFLELAEPSIPDGLQQLIDAGATHITVVPYFLSAGRHVSEDIPAEIEKVTQKNPDVSIRLAPYVGLCSAMPGLLLQQAAEILTE